MRLLLTLSLFTLILPFCKTDNSPICTVDVSEVITPYENRTLLTSDSNHIKEYRDLGKDTITGGYYSFKNGLLESYYFFTGSDTTYIPKVGDQVIEQDYSTNKITFCSYAEFYNEKGQLSKTIDIPLVYRQVNLMDANTICVNAKFFGLNKVYKDIQAKTNTGYVSRLSLYKDTLFTNMKNGCFQFGFGNTEDIRIYISGSYSQSCLNDWQTFSDTISLKYKDGKLTTSG